MWRITAATIMSWVMQLVILLALVTPAAAAGYAQAQPGRPNYNRATGGRGPQNLAPRGSWERTDGSKMMSKMIEKKTRGVTTARAQKFRQAMYDAMGEKGDEIMRPEVQELDQLKAEEKQSSQQTQPQEGAVDGEEVAAAAEAQVEKAARGAAEGKQAKATPAAQSAADDDAYDEDEEGSALSDKLEMFITYMLIAGVVGGLGILIYRLSSGELNVSRGLKLSGSAPQPIKQGGTQSFKQLLAQARENV